MTSNYDPLASSLSKGFYEFNAERLEILGLSLGTFFKGEIVPAGRNFSASSFLRGACCDFRSPAVVLVLLLELSYDKDGLSMH